MDFFLNYLENITSKFYGFLFDTLVISKQDCHLTQRTFILQLVYMRV